MALASLGLNLAGATWGLPARWHPDEKADVSARMAATGDLSPDSFINPSLPLYLMLPVVAVQSRAAAAGLLGGHAADPLLAGRVLSALAGAAAVLVLGLAARSAYAGLGIWPALFLAASPGFVNLCHFATPEPWLLLGAAATLAAAVGHAAGRVPAWALGLVLGLAVSTKYTAAALAAPALLAVWLRSGGAAPRRLDRAAFVLAGLAALGLGAALAGPSGQALAARLHVRDARLLHPEGALAFVASAGWASLAVGTALVLAGAAAGRGWKGVDRIARRETLVLLAATATGFFVGTPYALDRRVVFLSDLAFNHQTRFEYKGLVAASTSYGSYLGLLSDAVTGPLLTAAAVGLLVALARTRRDASAALVAAAAVAPYLLVASGGHQALRFLAPALPGVAWLAALGVGAVADARLGRIAALLVASRAALGALLVTRLFFTDSRLIAREWLARNVPPGETIDLIANNPGYAPPAPLGRRIRMVPVLSREMAPPEKFAEAASRYRDEAAGWLVLTASYYERFLEHPAQAPERAAFFSDLLEGRGGFEVVARFRQRGWRRPPAEFLDPEVVVLRRVPAGPEAGRGSRGAPAER